MSEDGGPRGSGGDASLPDKPTLLKTVEHKAHNGVSFLIMYELANKLWEYIPQWIEPIKQFLEGVRHAHV